MSQNKEEDMKKKILSLLLASVMVFSIAGCGADESAKEPEKTEEAAADEEVGEGEAAAADFEPLRVMTSPDFNGVILSYILDKGWADEIGLELQVESYANGAAGNEGLAAGLWDVGFEGMAYVFGSVNNNAKLVVTSSSTKGDTLFVREDSPILGVQGFNPTYENIYGDPDTVENAEILCAAGSSTHQLALQYIEKVGLSADQISVVPMDYATCEQTFALGEGDIVALPTPWSLQVADKYGWVPIAELSDFTTSTTDIIVAEDAYTEKEDEIVAFIQLCFRAAEEMEADREMKADQIIKYYTECGKEISDEDAAKEAELRVFITPEEHQALEYGVAEADAADFLAEIGSIEPEQAEEFKANVVDNLWKKALEEYPY